MIGVTFHKPSFWVVAVMILVPVDVPPTMLNASASVRPVESMVSRVLSVCAVVPVLRTVGVWKISELTAPAPVPLPLARVKLPPVLSVPVIPEAAQRVCETAAPLTSVPS